MSTFMKLRVAVLSLMLITAQSIAKHHDNHSKAGNIVEVASAAGTFNTLLTAATAAGLADALTDDGPLTIFAPSDDAFGALPAGTVDALLKEENRDQLVRILTYHVVSGQIGSDALADKVTLKTLAGSKVVFAAAEQGLTVEGARITATDIKASNGLVHVIDRVLMPPKQYSRSDAQQIILAAINKGAPMFNHGNHQATAKIYAKTMHSLIDSAMLRKSEVERLEKALQDSAGMRTVTDSAWTLRYALDDVMASLTGQNT